MTPLRKLAQSRPLSTLLALHLASTALVLGVVMVVPAAAPVLDGLGEWASFVEPAFWASLIIGVALWVSLLVDEVPRKSISPKI
jgi:hypothetical protein